MQTNEISCLLVDCTALQASSGIPILADTVLFGATLTEALETMDGQTLPVDAKEGTKEPEDLSTESAEAGNCLALTWNSVPVFAAAPEPSVPKSNPSPTAEALPNSKTAIETLPLTPAPISVTSPESNAPT